MRVVSSTDAIGPQVLLIPVSHSAKKFEILIYLNCPRPEDGENPDLAPHCIFRICSTFSLPFIWL
jgi:hypothetical protein